MLEIVHSYSINQYRENLAYQFCHHVVGSLILTLTFPARGHLGCRPFRSVLFRFNSRSHRVTSHSGLKLSLNKKSHANEDMERQVVALAESAFLGFLPRLDIIQLVRTDPTRDTTRMNETFPTWLPPMLHSLGSGDRLNASRDLTTLE